MLRFKKDPSLDNARSAIAYWGWFSNSDARGFMVKHQETFNQAKRVVSQNTKV